MNQPPKLQLPDSRPSARSGVSALVVVLLLIVLSVQILGLFIVPAGFSLPPSAARRVQLSPELIRDAALELERKNVSGEAAELWSEYLATSPQDAQDEGNIRYRIGKNRQNAGDPQRAYAQYVMAEALLKDTNPELRDEIGRRRRECLRSMGQFADLAREIGERAAPAGQENLDDVQVVAEIGAEKITASDFDRMLTEQIDLAVRARPGQTPAEEQAMREQLHKQLADPQRRTESLSNLVATRVLADEARKQQLHESDVFRERLTDMADGVLAQTLLLQEVSKRATITDEDITRFHAANRDRYAQPAGTFIAHVLCADEAAARAVIERVQAGEPFEAIAKSDSRDQATKNKGGVIVEPVAADGDEVPMFGKNADLHRAIREAEASALLPVSYQSARGWHVIKVISHRTQLDPPLDEIRDSVRRDTVAARTQEVTEQYLRELQNQYQVKLYPQALGATSGTNADTSPAEASTQGAP